MFTTHAPVPGIRYPKPAKGAPTRVVVVDFVDVDTDQLIGSTQIEVDASCNLEDRIRVQACDYADATGHTVFAISEEGHDFVVTPVNNSL